jgi:hypothetical protein
MQPLPRGERGTLQTLKLMAAFCKRDAASPELRAVAHRIIENAAGHDFSAEIRALYYFARDQIKYRKDPVEVERVQDALRTLQFRSGDCDDKAVLLVTLLAVCGHRARLCVSGSAPGRWSHVYCEVATPQGWMPLDPTPESAQPGWQTHAPAKGIFEIWPVTSVNVRVVRAQVPRSAQSARRQVQQIPVAAFSCLDSDCANEFGMGADKYEWKMNSAGECTLEKKKCGFFCKIGKGFKAVGKIALTVAPIALAPFTGGASLAAGAAMSGGAIAANIAATAAPSVVQMIASRSGAPANAQVEEPTGACRAWLEKKQHEENEKVRQAAEAAAAAQAAEQNARIQAEAKKLADSQNSSGSNGSSGMSALTGNPLLLGAIVIGGLLLMKK